MTELVSPLAAGLKLYSVNFPGEAACVTRFLELLKHRDAYQRTHLPGHITGSAFIVSQDFTATLLVHHAKLNRWLQPGGHADGDEDVARVAMREANEETGLQHLHLASADIYDLDIHPIPLRKDFPAHDHYDIRFLVIGSRDEPIVVSEESFDVRWVALDELEHYTSEVSLLRMRTKLKDHMSNTVR